MSTKKRLSCAVPGPPGRYPPCVGSDDPHPERAAAAPVADGGRTMVEDASGRRPFMRGILIHSLMARGVPFEDAFRAANEVRRRLRGRPSVGRAEIVALARELVGPDAFDEDGTRAPRVEPITVTGHGRESPFSKGTLSQSLLAAAIDPNDAFDVARGIELSLLERGVHRIERRELRRLAYEGAPVVFRIDH